MNSILDPSFWGLYNANLRFLPRSGSEECDAQQPSAVAGAKNVQKKEDITECGALKDSYVGEHNSNNHGLLYL